MPPFEMTISCRLQAVRQVVGPQRLARLAGRRHSRPAVLASARSPSVEQCRMRDRGQARKASYAFDLLVERVHLREFA